MGDGSRTSDIPNLFTYGFGLNGNSEIKQFIQDRFKISFDIRLSKEDRITDKCYYLKAVKGEDSDRFFELVAPHIIPSMQYKLPAKFRGYYQNVFE